MTQEYHKDFQNFGSRSVDGQKLSPKREPDIRIYRGTLIYSRLMNGLFSYPWLSPDLCQQYLARRLVAECNPENQQRAAALNGNNCATSSPASPSGPGYGFVPPTGGGGGGATGFVNDNRGVDTTTPRILPNDWNFGHANTAAVSAGWSNNHNNSTAWSAPTTNVDTCSPMSTVARTLVNGYTNSNWYAMTKGLIQNHWSNNNNNNNSAAPVWNNTTIPPSVQNCNAWQRPLVSTGNLPVAGNLPPIANLAKVPPLALLDTTWTASAIPPQPSPALWTAALAAVGAAAAATVEVGTLQTATATATTTEGLRTSDRNVQSSPRMLAPRC
jgi:hypothetical protein